MSNAMLDSKFIMPLATGGAAALAEAAWPAAPALLAESPEVLPHSGLSSEVHADIAAVEAAWTAFEVAADCTPFQLFARLAKWQQHVGARNGVTPAIVCSRDDKGRLLAVLPLAVSRGPLRRLTWLGTELSDYNAPLLAPQFHAEIDAARFALLWEEILHRLQGDARWHHDLVDLAKMPARIGAQPNPFLTLRVISNPNPALAATLGGKWEDFYAAKRSPATRKRERKQLRQLAEHGAVRFVEPQDKAEALATLDTMLAQKARAFGRMGVDNIFGRPGHRAFLQDIATDPALRDVVHLTRLDVGDAHAAGSLGLRFRGSYYLVLSSYHDGDISRFGPGRAHLQELLRRAMDDGFERFDFTIGEEGYKRDWSDLEVSVYDHLAAATLRGWLVVATHAAVRRAKRAIKRNAALWQAARRARAVLGAVSARVRSTVSPPPIAPLPEVPPLYGLAPDAADMAPISAAETAMRPRVPA